MVIDFSKLSKATQDLIAEYKEGLQRNGTFSGECTYVDGSEQHPSWFQDLFDTLDEVLDHREAVDCDTKDGKVNYLGQTGLPQLLNIRQYLAVIRAEDGPIVIDYTTGGIKDPSVRNVRIVTGDCVYFIRNDRDHIIDYPFELMLA